MCKIHTNGYYIPWGKEQCMIFARKLGPEYDKEKEVVDLTSIDFLKGHSKKTVDAKVEGFF